MTDIFQRSFAGGEISPDLYARSDQTKYQTGLRECTNFYIRKSGGVSNRAGTRFIAEANRNTIDTFPAQFFLYRLIPFVFSNDQSYVLEFGHRSLRVIKSGAMVRVAPANWDPNIQYLPGQSATYAGLNYVAENGSIGRQPDISSDEWQLLAGTVFQQQTPLNEQDLAGLRYHQINDVMYFVHGQFHVSLVKLIRAADDRWYFQYVSLSRDWVYNVPPYTPVTNVAVGGFAGGTHQYTYRVTAVDVDGHESFSYGEVTTNPNVQAPSSQFPIDVIWILLPSAVEYRIYRANGPAANNAGFGFVGKSVSSSFKDIYENPDLTDSLPVYAGPDFHGSEGLNTPSAIGMIQQRLVLANFQTDPERIWLSKTGDYETFTAQTPIEDDDALNFVIAAKRFSRIFFVIEMGAPIVFTETGEWILKGDVNGTVTPTNINAQQRAAIGSAPYVMPVQVDDTLIYTQSRGSVVRDFNYQVESDGYKGTDLTVFATHLFENNRIIELDYQQNPDSVIWALRNDGVLLGLSYLREHAIWGWHRHVTDGKIIHICVIPEGNTDVLYLMVQRTVGSALKNYVERLDPRIDFDPLRMLLVDCGLSYNGLNSTAVQVMLNPLGGSISTPITPDDIATLSATDNMLTTGDVGNAIVLYRRSDDGATITDRVQLNIVAYIDGSHVAVTPNRDVPTWAIGTLTINYFRAVDEFSNLGHLEGKSVAIVADGNVVADGYVEPLYVVTGGKVTLDRAASFVHIGLPYQARLETLDIDLAQGQTTVRSKPKKADYVSLVVKKTPVLMVGTSFDRLTETKIRELEDMGEPTQAKTGLIEVAVDTAWDEETRICVVQDQPLPATVLTVMPSINIAKE